MQLFTLIFLAAAMVLAAHLWGLAWQVGAFYLAASVLSYAMYAWDKAAARAGRRRVSERSLLLAGLACGWPGAVLAQQSLRHKSSKPSFLLRFWCTVLINVGIFAWLGTTLKQFP